MSFWRRACDDWLFLKKTTAKYLNQAFWLACATWEEMDCLLAFQPVAQEQILHKVLILINAVYNDFDQLKKN